MQGISTRISSGERIGLIGSTGSGKTTLVDHLMGLLEPTQGTITVDNKDIYDSTNPSRILSWRASIAHVPQNIFLTDNSIAENIAFGLPSKEIDFKKIVEAANQAQISGFIDSLPNGYNTFVGERGIRLSGGQRQRIGIARALYKEASVIIFDEATSALDTFTEDSVIAALDSLSRKVTLIMVAHRLSTVKNCDRLIVLDGGKIVREGSPSQILPMYSKSLFG